MLYAQKKSISVGSTHAQKDFVFNAKIKLKYTV